MDLSKRRRNKSLDEATAYKIKEWLIKITLDKNSSVNVLH